jgi:hypothetical protein
MDVNKLRAELEEQLAKNPHEDAPDGFRDRFEAAVADDGPKDEVEAQLRRIRDEAEAAARAVHADAPAPKPPGLSAPRFAQRSGIALAAAAAAAIAGFFYFR